MKKFNSTIWGLAIILLLSVALAYASTVGDNMTYEAGIIQKTRTHTADTVLGESDCGKIHFVGTAGVDITLPPLQDGCEITVSLTANFTTTNITVVVSTADDNSIEGSLTVNYANVACTTEGSLNFVNSAEIIGDYVHLISDGSDWNIIDSRGNGAGGITCTT